MNNENRIVNRLNAGVKSGDVINETKLLSLYKMANMDYFGAMDTQDQD